jgi:IclR family KDG regulon transcriptional repressor
MNSNKTVEHSYRVKSAERIFDILDCFTFNTKELSLSEIASKTGLHKTTVKRLIANLLARGYLRQVPSSRRYQLGLRLFELGGIVFSSFSLRRAAASYITHLRNETGATVLLGVLMESQLVYIDRRGGRGTIYLTSEIGWRRPPHFGMLGMVLMSHLDPEEVDSILEQFPLQSYTPYAITDKDLFRLRLEKIRSQGYVLESEEAIEGTIGVAAPIRDYSRKVIGALGIAMFQKRSNQRRDIDSFVRMVKKACDDISADLGYLRI